MSDVKWIKIVVDIFDDEKIRYIETLPNGDTTIVIWFRLLCLAGKSNSGGVLMMTDRIAYTDEMLSSIFNRDIKVIQFALSIFEKLGMIELLDNRFYLSNWEKHQDLGKLEQKKVYDREYQKKKRDEKLISYDNRTTIVEQKHDNRITDIELEEDKKNKIKDIGVFDKYCGSDEELRNTLNDFEIMRRSSKKPLTHRGKELLCKELDKLKEQSFNRIECLNNSIMNNWQGVFAPKQEVKKGRSEPVPYYHSEKPALSDEEFQKIKERLRKIGEKGDLAEKERLDRLKNK